VEPIDEAGAQAVPSHLATLKGVEGALRPGPVDQPVCFLDHLVSYHPPVVDDVVKAPADHAAATTQEYVCQVVDERRVDQQVTEPPPGNFVSQAVAIHQHQLLDPSG
jgi:hypothetical protein